MISQYSLTKALTNKSKEISLATGIEFYIQGDYFDPSPTQRYIAEKVIITETEGKLGAGSDTQRGFYQLNVCTPISSGKFVNLEVVDAVRSYFPNGVGAQIEYEGQIVAISDVAASSMYKDETHLKTALTIRYTVIA